MSYDLGTARGVIELEYNGRGVQQASQDVGSLTDKNSQAGAGLNKMANVAGAAGLAIAAGLGVGVNAAANFEQRMSAIAAVSGATGPQLDALRQKALDLGKDTSFSADESAIAMEELVKAGLSVDDVLNGAADATVALAAAGEVDLPTAATIASNAMNQFGLKAGDMPGVADAIAGAANASAISVEDFGQSLSQVGAVANLTGTSFDDTATAIALMGNAGIKGSDAGTSLKTMLTRLNPSTEKASNLMQDLGIITKDGSNRFFDAQGNMKSLADVSGVLQGALKGQTKEQKLATLSTLFGSDAIRGASVLADQGAAGFNKMGKAMSKVTAAEVAAKRMDNFKGSLEELKGSLETAGIVLGSILLPIIRKIVDGLTGLLNKFLELSPGMQKAVVVAAALASGLLLTFAAFVKIMQGIAAAKSALLLFRSVLVGTTAAQNMSTAAAVRQKVVQLASAAATRAQAAAMAVIRGATVAWTAVQWALNAALLANPIGLIIAAIVALIAIFVLAWKNSETFRKIVIGAWNAIKSASVAVWGFIKRAIAAAWGFIKGVVRAGVNFVKGVVTTGLNIIKGIWQKVWGVFGPLVKAVWKLIVSVIRLQWTIIKGVVLAAFNVLKAIFTRSWDVIKKVTSTVWNGIKKVISTVVDAVKAVVTRVWNAIKSATTTVWNAIKSAIDGPLSAAKTIVSNIITGIKTTMSAAWNAIKSGVTSAWNGIKSAVSTGVDNVMNAVTGLKDRVVGFFSGAASWLYDKGKAIIQGLIDGIASMISAVADKVNSVTDAVGRFLPGSPVKEGPLKVLNRGRAGKQIVQMVIDGIADMARPLAGAMAGAVAPVPVPGGAAGLTPVNPPSRGGRGRGGGSQRPSSRLVSGTLRLDKSGRAFIRAVADDATDDAADHDDTIARMG